MVVTVIQTPSCAGAPLPRPPRRPVHPGVQAARCKSRDLDLALTCNTDKARRWLAMVAARLEKHGFSAHIVAKLRPDLYVTYVLAVPNPSVEQRSAWITAGSFLAALYAIDDHFDRFDKTCGRTDVKVSQLKFLVQSFACNTAMLWPRGVPCKQLVWDVVRAQQRRSAAHAFIFRCAMSDYLRSMHMELCDWRYATYDKAVLSARWSVAKYLRVRRPLSGAALSVSLMLLFHDFDAPADELVHAGRVLLDLVSDVITIACDVLGNDASDTGDCMTILALMSRQDALSLHASLTQQIDAEFRSLAVQHPRFARLLRDLPSRALVWQSSVPRSMH